MLSAPHFNDSLFKAGFDFFTGVPCSLLGAAMQDIAARQNYIGATSEGEAIAIAAGASLAGRKPAIFMQNSGLGNAVNPITSLNIPFRIPSLLVIGWRGMKGVKDEPQHEMMGTITPKLLELMGITYWHLPKEDGDVTAIIEKANAAMGATNKPVALLVKPGTFEASRITKNSGHTQAAVQNKMCATKPRNHGAIPARYSVLEACTKRLPSNAAIIATTGKCGRELFTIKDCPQHLYMIGAMGSASAVGLGVASESTKPIVVLDGDGAALMRLGTFSAIGRVAPKNLIHIILDNHTHDSTGGQPTGSEHVDFVSVATACGYKTTISTDSISTFTEAISLALKSTGPHLIHMSIKSGSKPGLARPTIAPHDVAKRFSTFLTTQ